MVCPAETNFKNYKTHIQFEGYAGYVAHFYPRHSSAVSKSPHYSLATKRLHGALPGFITIWTHAHYCCLFIYLFFEWQICHLLFRVKTYYEHFTISESTVTWWWKVERFINKRNLNKCFQIINWLNANALWSIDSNLMSGVTTRSVTATCANFTPLLRLQHCDNLN